MHFTCFLALLDFNSNQFTIQLLIKILLLFHNQKYKLERYFDFLDFDNNQRVDADDLVLWTDKAVIYFNEDGVSVSDGQKKKLLKLVRRGCKYNRKTRKLGDNINHIILRLPFELTFLLFFYYSQCNDRIWLCWKK